MSDIKPSRRLLNATAIMASGTMISRLLGLARALMIAIVLGNATMRVEVFTFALTVPNSLYILFAGGTLNNVLVPQIVRAVTHDADQGKAFVDRLMTGFFILLGALAAILTLLAPWVMSIYTDSTWRGAEFIDHWQSLLLMSFITMPQIFFYGVFFLIGQVLNAKDKFGPMMWAPIANNVVSIAVFGVYLGIWGSNASVGQPFTTEQAVMLGVGSTLGIVIQTLVLVPYLRRLGFSYRPRFDLRHTGLGRTFHVAKWMVGYVGLTSLAQLVVQRLLSSATSVDQLTHEVIRGAGLNAYQNGYLIWLLPHSLITVSLATAMLPQASRHAQAKEYGEMAAEVTRALRMAVTFLVPACLGFLVLADPIVGLIYSHGAGSSDYQVIAWALACFAVGLVPYTMQYLYLRAFYAFDNTRTPFLLQIAISGANVALALALFWAVNWPQTLAARMALSYSLAYILGFAITHRALRKRLPQLDTAKLVQHLVRLAVASVPAAGLAWLVTWAFAGLEGTLWRVAGLVAAALVGIVVFFLAARLMHIAEADQLISVLRRKGISSEEILDVEQAELETERLSESADAGPGGAGASPGSGLAVDGQPPDPDLDTYPISPVRFNPQAGEMLGNRYRLDLMMPRRGTTLVWRAFDEVLQRNVNVHLLAPGDPRTEQVLAVAKLAATATDARVLRVLDIVVEDDVAPAGGEGAHGAYLVTEFVEAQSLAAILANGPLSGGETAWVLREVSDALSGCHAAGLYHRHLNPNTVLITANGNVKIAGMLVDEALNEIPSTGDDEASDVHALGRLLFACLSAHWPGRDGFGLPGGGKARLPGELRKVPADLDAVVDRILSPIPKRWASRLTTAQEVTTALSLVLGPVSSAQDLRARLELPTDEVPLSSVVPPSPTPIHDEDEAEDALPFVEEAMDNAEIFTPVPPPPPPAKKSGSRKWVSVLVIGIGLAILAAAIIVLNQPPLKAAPAVPEPMLSPSPTLVAVKIVSADDFDPKADGGSGGENASAVKRAFDKKTSTAWRTERYRGKASYGGLKPGTGLVLDLRDEVNLAKVELDLSGKGTDLALYVPNGKMSMQTIKDWKQAASLDSVDASATITLSEPVKTRYLLVYLTSLPKDGSYYRGGIAEVRVFARE
ncbi:MAG: murein biosynthesis integral membrane protein MurJ [Propionibacteriaceae bacterium]|jgi:murein biosynthesis integral membrane protein MurJ|nr:murein biosynthesis integral membrane protein MurJ [Propionibacteriaceae bacterium]